MDNGFRSQPVVSYNLPREIPLSEQEIQEITFLDMYSLKVQLSHIQQPVTVIWLQYHNALTLILPLYITCLLQSLFFLGSIEQQLM